MELVGHARCVCQGSDLSCMRKGRSYVAAHRHPCVDQAVRAKQALGLGSCSSGGPQGRTLLALLPAAQPPVIYVKASNFVPAPPLPLAPSSALARTHTPPYAHAPHTSGRLL